jgi:hypothetical protein
VLDHVDAEELLRERIDGREQRDRDRDTAEEE